MTPERATSTTVPRPAPRPASRPSRAGRAVALAVAVTVALSACVTPTPQVDPDEDAGPPVLVGTGPEVESRLLAAVMAELMIAAGIPAEVEQKADSGDARQALELGAVGAQPGYTGEAWLEVLERPGPPGDPRTSFARVRDFDERAGILWLRPTIAREGGIDRPPANATFAFVVQGPPSLDADLRTVSQLATRLAETPDAPVCVDREFASRSDGLQAVFEAYRIRIDRPVLPADPETAVDLVVAGECMAGLTTATDGRAWAAGLQPLYDDLQVFPAFVVSPQVREDLRADRPEVVAALGPMAHNLTTAMLGRWNGRVVAGEPVETVARAAAGTLLELAGRAPVAPTPADA